MPEIIEVLTSAPIYSPKFVPNSSLVSVSITFPIDPFVFKNTAGRSIFSENDNIRILSCGYVLPESFAMATPVGADGSGLYLSLAYSESEGEGTELLQQFGQAGIFIPLQNYEMPVDIFIDINSLNIGQAFTLTGELNPSGGSAKVSMINVPNSLDGSDQYINVFVKILHNKIMVA